MKHEGKHFISNSEIQTFKRCRRKWYLSYYRKLASKTEDLSNIMYSGTRVHKALAQWYVTNRDPELDIMKVLDRIINEDRNTIMARVGSPDTNVFDHVAHDLIELEKMASYERAMVEGYIEWLEETGIDSELTLVAAEQEITIPYTAPTKEPIYFVGIVDALVYNDQQNRVAFIDHKTVQSLTNPMMTLRMNEQMLHYIYLLQEAVQARVEGAYYNMLKRVKRTATAKPPFYERVFIPHSSIEIESYRRHLFAVTHAIYSITLNLEQHDADQDTTLVDTYMYPSPTMDCSWSCPFFSVCPMFDDGSNVEGMLEYHYRKYEPLDRYATVSKKEVE